MSYVETLAKNKFNGDIEKARKWLKKNGQKGGAKGKKHFSKLSKKKLSEISKKGNKASQEARKRKDELEGMAYEDIPNAKPFVGRKK